MAATIEKQNEAIAGDYTNTMVKLIQLTNEATFQNAVIVGRIRDKCWQANTFATAVRNALDDAHVDTLVSNRSLEP